MSADDQRAATSDLEEAERNLREDAEHPLSAAVLAELARLRAELAETRAAGDALADAARLVINGQGTNDVLIDLSAKAGRWRSVRGDAPAPAVKAGKYNGVRYWDGPGWEVEERGGRVHLGSTPADARIELSPEMLTAIEAATAAARGDAPAPAEPPAVELPVTLSSPDNVAAGPPPQFERGFYRLARDISIKAENWHLAAGTQIEITHVVRPSQDYAVVSARRWPARVVPFAVLATAGAERIEAARSGSR